jgi:hypothetical protein
MICLVLLSALAPGESPVSFNRDVRPILSDRCFFCHGPDAAHRKAGLRLDLRESALEDGVIVPGKPERSELIRRINRKPGDKRQMPPHKSGKVLSAGEIELLRRWIAEGAKYERHWTLAPPGRPALPAVADAAWPSNAVDRFILARIEATKLRPSPDADRVTLIRRLTLDLTGLPPTPEEVDAFAAHDSSDAIERLVDRLLASPHFGERLAAYWLDLVRYADTVGYHGDQEHPIFPYRDYVIESLNANKPFDVFTTEQLAGDLLPNATIEQKIASGYNRLLQTTHEGGAQDKEYRAKYAADRVRNLSAVWMGATLGCAECHDHKYDPYTQKNFYRLAAFFADVQELGAYRGPDASPTKRPPELLVLPRGLDRREAARLEVRIASVRTRLGKERTPKLEADLKGLESQQKALHKRMAPTMITVPVTPRTMRVLKRGDWMDSSGEVVEPGVPESVLKLDVKGRRATRLDLARWLTSREHPQTARVFVNRVWALFFGVGLSRNLEDAGSQGEWPTHPELLDWLAVEFAKDWDVKRLVRLIVTSRTYRQASLETPALKKSDPDNRLFARQNSVRLPAEAIRDQALAASGLLYRPLGGPSARPYQPDGYYQYLNFPKRTYKADKGPEQYRRGLYVHWQRQFLQPMLRAFDAPSREECTAQRPVSNTPLQALTLLNDPTCLEAARVLAARVLAEGKRSDSEVIVRMWRLVLVRTPEEREVGVLLRLLKASREKYADEDEAKKLLSVGLAPYPKDLSVTELAAWASVARVLLNLDETITRG